MIYNSKCLVIKENNYHNNSAFYTFNYRVKGGEQPSLRNQFICDAIPTDYRNEKNIFPFIQVSKAGKSFLIRQLAVKKKYSRWVVLLDVASKNDIDDEDHLAFDDSRDFFAECKSMCEIRDSMIKNVKPSDKKARFKIHEKYFEECQKVSRYCCICCYT